MKYYILLFQSTECCESCHESRGSSEAVNGFDFYRVPPIRPINLFSQSFVTDHYSPTLDDLTELSDDKERGFRLKRFQCRQTVFYCALDKRSENIPDPDEGHLSRRRLHTHIEGASRPKSAKDSNI